MEMIRPFPQKPPLVRQAESTECSLFLPIQSSSSSSPQRSRTPNDLRPRGFFLPAQQPPPPHPSTPKSQPYVYAQGTTTPRTSSPWTIESRDTPSLRSAAARSYHSAFSPFPFQQHASSTNSIVDYSTTTTTPRKVEQHAAFSCFVPIHSEDETRRSFTPSSDYPRTPTNTFHAARHHYSSKGKDSPAVTVDTAPLTIAESPSFLHHHSGGRFVAAQSPSIGSPSFTLRSPTPPPTTVTFRDAGAFTPHSVRPRVCFTPTPTSASRPVSTVPRGATPTTSSTSRFNSSSNLKVRPKSAPPLCTRIVSEDEMARKIRIKTELCLHFENGGECPFGDNCTYAHGAEELQMTKLVDLHDAGLVDMETYRIKPCWTWVATGSCPFGKRCTGIHDARCVVSGGTTTSSWLPHTETQGNTIATDINVESLHQKRTYAILYNNPFGDQFHLHSSTFDDLYRLVNGLDSNHPQPQQGKQQRHMVHPIYKLQIALMLRGETSDWQYKYRPQHVMHDELCMVLQKRAFRVRPNDKTAHNRLPYSSATSVSSAVEIPLSSYSPRNQNDILVHELAFGPDADATVRGVALWFNIKDCDITECTPQQAKRFRWKKQGKKAKKSATVTKKPSVFDSGTIDTTPMVRPHDAPANDLVTRMLLHRLQYLQCDLMCNLGERFELLQALDLEKVDLQASFCAQRRDWMAWAWPADLGRDCVDANTPVPAVEGPYRLSESSTSHACHLWNSFVDNVQLWGHNSTHDALSAGDMTHSSRRLPIFVHLSKSYSTDPTLQDHLPHILKHRASPSPTEGSNQDRCWKALMLESKDEHNEWVMVRDHFEKSRSKKVLTILQQ